MQQPTLVSPIERAGLLTRVRLCLAIVILGLLLSGLTAFPLVRESQLLLDYLARTAHFSVGTPLYEWILTVHRALVAESVTAPFLAYGTDWLALAHLLFAVLFLGPYRDPVRNQWVIDFGLISCIGVVLLAFIAGPIRSIPLFWRWVDASFAILCALPLLLCRHYLHLLARLQLSARHQRARTRRQRRLGRTGSARRAS